VDLETGRTAFESLPGAGLLRALQSVSGLVFVLAVGAYTLFGAAYAEPEEIVMRPARGLPQQPVITGNAVPAWVLPVEPSLVVHLACAADDAQVARVYDAAPTGRGLVLRLDQSRDEISAVIRGTDRRYPADTRLVTTPCMQQLLDSGEFP